MIHEYCDNPEILNKTDIAVREIGVINDFCNQLVHSFWLGSDDSRRFAIRSKIKANRKKGFQYSFERLKKKDLIEKCNEVAILTETIQEIYQMINTEPSL